jgi:hypothetical protein
LVTNTDCSRWASVQKTDDGINPSGTNDVDRVSCSIVFYHFVDMCIFSLLISSTLFTM